LESPVIYSWQHQSADGQQAAGTEKMLPSWPCEYVNKFRQYSCKVANQIVSFQLDCKAHGLNREVAMDRSRWRKQIEIFDDHDVSG